MDTIQVTKPLKHFAKHLFLASRVYVERNKAREDLNSHLERMTRSIIRMTLSYTDMDKLREKIGNLIKCERECARFFHPKDSEKHEFKSRVIQLEEELAIEKEEKNRIKEEHLEQIKQLTESLANLKSKINHLFMEKAKRHHRLKALEHKIRGKVDSNDYYSS